MSRLYSLQDCIERLLTYLDTFIVRFVLQRWSGGLLVRAHPFLCMFLVTTRFQAETLNTYHPSRIDRVSRRSFTFGPSNNPYWLGGTPLAQNGVHIDYRGEDSSL